MSTNHFEGGGNEIRLGSTFFDRSTGTSTYGAENIFRKMIEEVRDYAILLLDIDGNIVTWNLGAEDIKGYKSDEIIGKNFRVFYLPEDRASGLPDSLLAEAQKSGRVVHEGWRVKKDGSTFWGSVTITALHDEQANVVGFSKVTRDLTERQKSLEQLEKNTRELREKNEELRSSEERYHQMVAEVEDYAILLLDTDGNVLNWNKGAENIKGYTSDEIIGKNFRIFYLPEDRADGLPERLLADAILNGKATHEGWRVRKGGAKLWGQIVITALHDAAGNIIGFTKVTRDLTRQKGDEDRIRRQNKSLEEYAYVASHDLQEPLRKIRIFADLARRALDENAESSAFLDRISISAERMSKLITGVLDYSRAGDDQHLKETVDLNVTLAEVMLDFELSISERNCRIEVDNLPLVRAVPIQMQQLFSNLISNALRFTGPDPQISIRSSKTGNGFCKITISDNGIGFDPLYAGKMFLMFQKLHGPGIGGTGIGLALCKQIVEGHGGKIVAKSSAQGGASFEFTLPLGGS